MRSDDALTALIPHQGAMCLLDKVVAWDPEHVVLTTRSHRSPDNPLRSEGHLRALHLCEYGAQAMAVHGGLMARAAGTRAQPGLLVSLRDVKLFRSYVDDLPGELRVEARRLAAGSGAWQYTFEVRHADKPLAAGRAAIMAQDAPARAAPPAPRRPSPDATG